jgi:hypothetical protein
MPGGGYWAEPDLDHLAERMRWCREQRDVALDFGEEAAAWLRQNQTWIHAGHALVDLLERYA